MAGLTLTTDELQTITHRVKFSAQIKQLQRMGIEYRRAADGSPVVSRQAFEQVMGVKQQAAPGKFTPNLDFLNAPKEARH